MELFTTFMLYFTVYAFFGWVWELVYVWIVHHRLHLHGFLRIPLLPIYGFSAVLILLFVQPYVDNPFLVLAAGVGVVSLIELITGLVLDKIFHLRLWDYRSQPLNINGYTGFYTSLGFGVMVLFLVYVVQPWVESGVQSLSSTTSLWLAWILFGVIVIDFINSLSAILQARIASGKMKAPSLEQVQTQLDGVARALKASRRNLVNRLYTRLQSSNISWIRDAFPGAEITNHKK